MLHSKCTGHPAHRSESSTISARPGREVVQNRVDIIPEAPAFKHKHLGEEIIYVLERRSSIESRAGRRRRSMRARCFFVPAETVHSL
jgi:quercetin dioxygenase-like cupin family protein